MQLIAAARAYDRDDPSAATRCWSAPSLRATTWATAAARCSCAISRSSVSSAHASLGDVEAGLSQAAAGGRVAGRQRRARSVLACARASRARTAAHGRRRRHCGSRPARSVGAGARGRCEDARGARRGRARPAARPRRARGRKCDARARARGPSSATRQASAGSRTGARACRQPSSATRTGQLPRWRVQPTARTGAACSPAHVADRPRPRADRRRADADSAQAALDALDAAAGGWRLPDRYATLAAAARIRLLIALGRLELLGGATGDRGAAAGGRGGAGAGVAEPRRGGRSTASRPAPRRRCGPGHARASMLSARWRLPRPRRRPTGIVPGRRGLPSARWSAPSLKGLRLALADAAPGDRAGVRAPAALRHRASIADRRGARSRASPARPSTARLPSRCATN